MEKLQNVGTRFALTCRCKKERMNVLSTTTESELKSSAESFLTKNGWKCTIKQLNLCKSRLGDAKKAEDSTKRVRSAEDQTLASQISEQNWPNIRLRCAGNKGTGAFAAADIDKDTLLCDYHGSLVNDEEGWR